MTIREPEQTTSWKTTDGQIFDNPAGAKRHQRGLDFADWYKDQPIWVNQEKAKVGHVIDWITENRETVALLLGISPNNLPRQ